MYIAGASILVLLVFAIFSFARKRFLQRLVRKAILSEFEEELENRLRRKIHLEPADDELMELMLNSKNSEADKDFLNAKLNRMREEEKTKMMKEENFGLKP